MLDARRKLDVLRAEWSGCTRCELGLRRETYDGKFVFGEGSKRGIMFVGEGPGQKEEQLGRPFMGPSGILLRHILGKLQITDFYISNLVTCRSCSQAKTSDGEPVFFPAKRGRPPEPRWVDEPPLPPYWKACLPRLHEEIYLVDPCIVVTLGATAAEALLGKRIAITQKRGEPERLSIPGASYQAILTDKKQAWQRKHEGRWIAPTEQNEVHYYCLPTIHPAFVLRKLSDLHPDESPFRKLVDDIKFAVKVYDDFNSRSFGKTPPESSNISLEDVREGLDPEEQEELSE